MVITPGASCVAVADISDDSGRLFRVAGPAGSIALTANDGVSVVGVGRRRGPLALTVVPGALCQADRDHWLRLIAKLKGMLEDNPNPTFELLRKETRLRREFLAADWPYGDEPAPLSTPINVHDDDLTAAELQSRCVPRLLTGTALTSSH